jgi:hypothetical protein
LAANSAHFFSPVRTPSPDSILNEAQAVNFLFHALVTCDSEQIGYIDNRMKPSLPTPDAILQTAFGFWNSKVVLTADRKYGAHRSGRTTDNSW